MAKKLQLNWAPEQITGWFKFEFPGDESNHVSHETIYRSLFVQARGVLNKSYNNILDSSVPSAVLSTLVWKVADEAK